MNETVLEVSGEDVESAVEKGLTELGVSREAVNVEVVEEGRKSFMGLGGKEATVRLTIVVGTAVPDQPVEIAPSEPEIEAAGPTPSVEAAEVEAAEVEAPVVEEEEALFDPLLQELEALPDPDLLEEEETVQEVLETLLEKLDIAGTVATQLSEADDLGKQVVEVDINGEYLSDLIGRRGNTLYTLQYMARLMVSHRLQRRVEFVIDVDGYRKKRAEGLKSLAQRMASKALQRNRPVTLEPMSPYERRLIHVALRDQDDVFTKSIGEGSSRRVRIHPKN